MSEICVRSDRPGKLPDRQMKDGRELATYRVQEQPRNVPDRRLTSTRKTGMHCGLLSAGLGGVLGFKL